MKPRIHANKKVGLYRKMKNSFDLMKRGMYIKRIPDPPGHPGRPGRPCHLGRPGHPISSPGPSVPPFRNFSIC